MRRTHRPLLLCLLPALLLLTGCDFDEDKDLDRTPPEGFGSLVVNNQTTDSVRVFVNGEKQRGTSSFDARAYDLEPGVYRVVIEAKDSDRTFRDDIDILGGRRTVVDLSAETFDFDRFDAVVFVD